MLLLPFLALAWILGVCAAAFTDTDPVASIAAGSLISAVTFAVRPRASTFALIALGCGVIALAGWRYDATSGQTYTIERLNDGEPVLMRAVVDDEPQERKRTVLYRLTVRESFDGRTWREESGKVLMRGPLAPRYEYGDVLQIEGDLETPPSFPDFDYRDYLLRQGIVSLVSFPDAEVIATGAGDWWRAALIDVRAELSDALHDVLPGPQASLAAGILYGERGGIPDDLRDDMNATGTSHLVA